jgi:hypothetical protein
VSIERLTPTFTEHPVFETPPEGTTLWRYMDVARYLALLERRALFFASLRSLPDRFEGSLTAELLEDLRQRGERAVRERRLWNRASYVNCWNMDSDESVALWRMYSSPSGGVAIKSSVRSILGALEADRSGQRPPDELYIGRVRYVDYRTATIPEDNAFWPLVHKRTPYRFEQEVRLVVWTHRLIQAAQTAQPDAWWEALGGIAPLGYDVAVDPGVLIEGVVVAPEAPEWLVELIKGVTTRYGLTAPVTQSDLDADPI